MKIIGNPLGAPVPRTDYNQEDPAKSDYLKGREVIARKLEEAVQVAQTAQTAAQNAQSAADNAHAAADNAQSAAGNHGADKNNPHGVTAAQTGAVSKKLLWTNASPHSAFAAQTIAVSLSGYDYVEIHYRASAFGTYKSQVCKVGEIVHLDCVTGSSGAIEGAYCLSVFRIGTTSGTGIAFSKEVSVKQHGSDKAVFEENNTYAVPARIFGLKGVL